MSYSIKFIFCIPVLQITMLLSVQPSMVMENFLIGLLRDEGGPGEKQRKGGSLAGRERERERERERGRAVGWCWSLLSRSFLSPSLSRSALATTVTLPSPSCSSLPLDSFRQYAVRLCALFKPNLQVLITHTMSSDSSVCNFYLLPH